MTDLTPYLNDLLAKARAATPGPWTQTRPGTDPDGFAHGVAVAATSGRQMIYASPPGGSFPAADAAYIAAAHPAVTAALVEVAMALRPFAEAGGQLDSDDGPDEAELWVHQIAMCITLGELRAAAQALANLAAAMEGSDA